MTITRKLTLEEFQAWEKKYWASHDTAWYRLGQAFFNEHSFPGPNPDLFYERDPKKAVAKIMAQYVEMSE